jgi:hypothetical protein
MSARPTPELLDRLCSLSRGQYANPYETLAFPDALPPDALCTSPELVSLYGTATWEKLDEAGRTRLAFWEAINFFSLNINGERALIEGLAKRLYPPVDTGHSAYVHHFLDEENKHMIYFGTFCQKYGKKTYPDKKVVFAQDVEPLEGELRFYLKVLIFEEIADAHNVRMAKDERLVPLVRDINRMHHQDESRHLAFGRAVVGELWEKLRPTLSEERVQGLREYVGAYLTSTWREYYNPDAYRDAGIGDAYAVYRDAFAQPAAKAHRRELSRRAVRFLMDTEILEQEPTP